VINFSAVHAANGNSVYVGRGQDANVRITDISVSREHTLLTCIDGRYSLPLIFHILFL